MRKKIISIVVLVVAVAAALVALGNQAIKLSSPVEYIKKDAYGQKMIDFTLPDESGKPHTVSGDNDRPKLINFWTSWCKYCKLEADELNAIYAEYGDRIEFVSVNVTTSDTVSDARQFIEDYQVQIPALYDEEGEVTAQYRVMGIPNNYFIRKDGTVLAVTENITADNARDLLQQLVQ